jgi:hypothetical protein
VTGAIHATTAMAEIRNPLMSTLRSPCSFAQLIPRAGIIGQDKAKCRATSGLLAADPRCACITGPIAARNQGLRVKSQ